MVAMEDGGQMCVWDGYSYSERRRVPRVRGGEAWNNRFSEDVDRRAAVTPRRSGAPTDT